MKRNISLCAMIAALSLASTAAQSVQTTYGYDTPMGILDVPFAIQGIQVMDLSASGLAITSGGLTTSGQVGVGTTTPAATLDVAGDMRATASGQTLGAACLHEGAYGYDGVGHQPLYCAVSGKWSSLMGAYPKNHSPIGVSIYTWDENSTYIWSVCYAETDANGQPYLYMQSSGNGSWGYTPDVLHVQTWWSGRGKSAYSYNFVCSITAAGVSLAGTSAFSNFAAW